MTPCTNGMPTCIDDLLSVEERDELRRDLAEMNRQRRRALDEAADITLATTRTGGPEIQSRRLRQVRRTVAARLDLAGHDDQAAIIRRMSTPELITLDRLEQAS